MVSGVPTATGTFTVSLKVADAGNPQLSVTQSVAVVIGLAPLAIDTVNLTDATARAAYTFSFSAHGGTAPFTWSVLSGSLPAGLALSAAGVVSGAPTTAGTSTFSVRLTDGASPALTQQATFSLAVLAAGVTPVVVQSPSAAAGVNTPYSASFTAIGGTAPYSWSLASGTLPGGLSLSAAGVLSGTPTTAGTFSFTVQVADAATPSQVRSAAVSLTVSPALITVTTSSVADATVGSSYAQSLAATGGTPPYSWSVIGGALPAGLALSAAGVISGTPTAPGTFSFTVRVVDSASPSNTQTATFTLTARIPPPPALAVTTASLPAATVSVAYSATLAASGGSTPYTWSIVSGVLPVGLSLSPAGVITGTPSAVGSNSFTVQVRDSTKPSNSATRVLSISVNSATLAVATTTLPAGTVGASFSQSLAATGGTLPYGWSLVSGALPAGLTLNSAGLISGTPATAGSSSFTVQVSDSQARTATAALSITVSAASLAISTTALASGQINTAYSTTLLGSGGTLPYGWSVSLGSLPAGLTLTSDGVLAGTPTTAGSSSFTIRLADSGSPQQVRARVLTLTINPSSLSVATGSLPVAIVSTAYSSALAAAGGTPPYTWSIESGTLPAGLSLNASGVISGTATTAGSSSFTVKVVDSAATPRNAIAPLTLRVDPPALSVSTTALVAGTFNIAYSATLAASGGTAPYSWTLTAGALPSGLVLASDGTISGTPTTSGSSAFTVQVSDSQSPAATASRNLTLIINPAALAITSSTLPAGQATLAYSASLTGSGGVAPYTWSLSSGSLPAGLALGVDGVLSGTPTTAGSSSFIVQLSDAQSPSASATRAFTLSITPAPLRINTSSLADATVGNAYSASLLAVGGTSPYTWSLTAGSLPAGLSLSAAGAISGTAAAVVSSSFTVQVSDSQAPAASTTRTLTLTTSATPLTISTAVLASAAVGVPYTANLNANGGVAPYSWSLSSGSLPAGLSLSTGGVLSGTPTAAGSSAFTVLVSDSQAPAQSASKALTLVVSPASLVVTTASLANGAVAVAYNASLAATGGTAPYAWSVIGGSLPAGLSLSSAGVLSGTPNAAGSASFTVQVADAAAPANTATKPFTLTIAAAALVIDTATLPAGVAGAAYSSTLGASGGVPPYSWTIVAGALPAGLSLSTAGVLTGTPSGAGSSSFTVQVQDSQAPVHNTTKLFTLTVSPATLAITTATLADGVLGSAYSGSLVASGGTAPYSWSVVSGSLPSGLSLSSNGVFTGTPTAAGSSSFMVRVSDAQAPAATATRSYTLVINPAPLVITTNSVPTGQVGTAYSSTLAVSGGTAPYIWSLAGGSLPAGLSLSVSGVISGTPSAAGTAAITVQVQDSQAPARNTTQNLSLTINPAPLVISTTTLVGGQVAVAYSATLAATGGIAPYSWSVISGSLPAGLSLSSAGTISGTPTAAVTANFSVQVVDSQAPAHNTTQSLSLTVIAGALSVTTGSVANGNVGAAYSATLAASGGIAPYSWTVSSGALPAGLALSSGGVISGTPTAAGSAAFSVRVQDSQAAPANATRALTLLINPAALAVVTTSLPNGAIGTAYSSTLSASGGTAPYSWSLTAGVLPAGLSLSSGGVISGTPTAAVAATFTVQASDSQGPAMTATRSLTLTTFGSANVYWDPSTLRDDNSAFNDRAGYKIYYGTAAGALGNTQQVADAAAVNDVVAGLTAGSWYFAVTAYDGGNVESARTNVVSKTIP